MLQVTGYKLKDRTTGRESCVFDHVSDAESLACTPEWNFFSTVELHMRFNDKWHRICNWNPTRREDGTIHKFTNSETPA